MFRIRLLTFCTVPHAAQFAPTICANLRWQPLQLLMVGGGPRCDLLDRIRRNVDDLKTARGRELLAQDVIEQTDALDFYPCGRLERSIDELEAEEGNARHFLAVRPRVRSTAGHDGEEDSQCCLHGGGTFPRESLRYFDERDIAYAHRGCLPLLDGVLAGDLTDQNVGQNRQTTLFFVPNRIFCSPQRISRISEGNPPWQSYETNRCDQDQSSHYAQASCGSLGRGASINETGR